MPCAFRLLTLAAAVVLAEAEEEKSAGCFKKGVLYRDTELLTFFSKGVALNPAPTGGYLASAEACQEACRLSTKCNDFGYDATAGPGATGGACWFLYGNYTEVPNDLATSGPKVCPASVAGSVAGSVAAAGSELVKAGAGAVAVARDAVAATASAASAPAATSPSVAPPVISAKELFSNTAGEHAVGGIPGAAGEVQVHPFLTHHKKYFSTLDVTTITVLMLVAMICVIANCYCFAKHVKKKRSKRSREPAGDEEAPSAGLIANSARSLEQQAPVVPVAFQSGRSQPVYYTSQPIYYTSQPRMVQTAAVNYQPVSQSADQAMQSAPSTAPQ